MSARYRSRAFRFTDDLHCCLGPEVIHLRSASRVGHSDFGGNRRRVERLRRRLPSCRRCGDGLNAGVRPCAKQQWASAPFV